MTEKSCSICKNAWHLEEGYSNYTVEGTTFHCGLKAHPDGSFDEWYDKDKRLKFAEQCPKFEEGDGVTIDVECEEVENLTPEQKQVYDSLLT